MNEKEIEDRISKLRSDLKTERLDMSFGEIMSLYESKDLFISPEYQRAYRWDDFQKTRFIESILLGIPVPPIFVAENEESKWELVDGLQRISTVLSFFGLLDGKEKLVLTESELIGKPLEGISINELPIKFKLTIKRSVCRVEILKWDSSFDMRYELFNRLNTGGSPLKAQEIRNCVFIGDFNNLLNNSYLISKLLSHFKISTLHTDLFIVNLNFIGNSFILIPSSGLPISSLSVNTSFSFPSNNPKKDKTVDILCNPSTSSHLLSSFSATKIGGTGIPRSIDSINLVF
jgi:uncharacterized protein with ParB-like and HNH nuclease domain